MIETVKKYKSIGLSCLPVGDDKAPYKVKSWKDELPDSVFDGCFGIGVKCGEFSGGLECIDFDNHFSDAKDRLTKFIAEIKELYDKYKFPIESTMNGGYHFLYCCSEINGNKKLAQKPKWDEGRKKFIGDTIIETRGEGGYFVASPTPGYKIIKNDIFQIPLITKEERAEIFDICRSFNEYNEPQKTPYESNDKPGDLYNKSTEAISEAISILISAGWVEMKKGFWRRPTKSKGISATFGQVADNVFYVFSSNAYPFEPERGYLPFQILALLKYNGDFNACAKDLSEKYNPIPQKKEKPKTELKDLLKKSYINLDIEIEKPPVILYISDTSGTQTIRKRVFTLGNFSSIIGKAKSRKTFLVSMFTSACLKNDSIYYKFFGNLPDNKRQILYFDTEQGEYDAANNIKRILRLSEQSPDFIGAFSLRQFSPIERCDIISEAFSNFNNIGLVVIDGIADLAKAINDEDEATRVTTMNDKIENACKIILGELFIELTLDEQNRVVQIIKRETLKTRNDKMDIHNKESEELKKSIEELNQI